MVERQIEFEAILNKIEVDRNVSDEEKNEIHNLLSQRKGNTRLPYKPVKEGQSWVHRLAELNKKRAQNQLESAKTNGFH